VTWLADLTLETVVVHTRDGFSIKGLKAAVYDDCIVLRDGMVLEAESREVLNDLLVIPRENVSFMQVVQADGAS
jgi:hypothetical protein